MRNIKVLNVNGKKSYEIDGKKYDSFDDIPEDCKKLLEDKNQNNIPDFIEENEKLDKNRIIIRNVTVDGKRYNSIDEMPKELQERIEKGEFPNITKTEISPYEKINFNKSTESTNQSHDHFQTNEPARQYCDNCGNVLPDKSFLGYVKCESCSKRMKKKKGI